MQDRGWDWQDIAVIDMYIAKLGLAAKGKYFSSRKFDEVLACLKEAERCLAAIEVPDPGQGMMVACPGGLSHQDCFCEPT